MFYAASLGMVVGCGVAIAMVVKSGSTPYMQQHGGAFGLMVAALPGIIMLGMIFTFPSAMLVTFPLAALMRRFPRAGHPLVWGTLGAGAAVPVAWLFGAGFDEEFLEFPSVHVTLLVLGFACGLAGRWGYRATGHSNA